MAASATTASASTGRSRRRARQEAQLIVQTARAEGEAKSKELELEAEKKIAERRAQMDREIAEGLSEMKASQARAAKREETLDRKLESINQRETKIDQRETRIRTLEESAEVAARDAASLREQMRTQLGKVADMTRFHQRYPQADEDFPEITAKLRKGKVVTLTVEYDEPLHDAPDPQHIPLRDWIVRDTAQAHLLHRERFVGHRFIIHRLVFHGCVIRHGVICRDGGIFGHRFSGVVGTTTGHQKQGQQ